MDIDLARKVLETSYRHCNELNDLLLEIEANGSEADMKALKLPFARVMGELHLDICGVIYHHFPELKPDTLKR